MRKLFLILATVWLIHGQSNAQNFSFVDTLRWDSLIISEVCQYGNWGYIELCNTSSDSIDLSLYWLATQWNDRVSVGSGPYAGNRMKLSLSGKLAAGETYIISGSYNNTSVLPSGEKIYPNGYTNIYWDAIADYRVYEWQHSDEVPGSRLLANNIKCLFFRGDMDGDSIRDSIMVDKFWYEGKEVGSGKPDTDMAQYPIAGVITQSPPTDYCYIRKFKYSKGNTDFLLSAGTNIDDSEWIPVPKDDLDYAAIPFTTLGNHLNKTTFDVTSNVGNINVSNKSITLPYGIRRDSLLRTFTIGKNISWNFRLGQDSSQFYVSNTDSIDFYVIGNTRIKYSFGFIIENKPVEFAFIRPLLYKLTNGKWTYKYRYALNDIYDIPFNEPIDSIHKYIIVENGATGEFIWADGIARPEVMDGDQYKIVSGNTVHVYTLHVNKYYASYNSTLKTIYFPGNQLWENATTFEMTDTFLNFSPNGLFYTITLPEGIETSPAIVGVPADPRSTVHIKKAKNLFGSKDDKTAVITVKAENDTSISTYKILFEVSRPTPPIVGEPFITDISGGWGGNWTKSIFQIYNPTESTINLSDYMFCRIDKPSLEGFANAYLNDFSSFYTNNKELRRPGYVVKPNLDNKCYFATDDVQNRSEVEGNGTYTMISNQAYPVGTSQDIALNDRVDYAFQTNANNNGFSNQEYWMSRFGGTWAPTVYEGNNFPLKACGGGHLGQSGKAFALLKIVNDSVYDGTKAIAKNFEGDFEVVDIIGGISSEGIGWVFHDYVDTVTGLSSNPNNPNAVDSAINIGTDANRNSGIYRKPYVYSGNPIDDGSLGSEGHAGEWVIYGTTSSGGQANILENGMGTHQVRETRFDNHLMITYAHIPYISSNVYVIERGLEGSQNIFGVVDGTSIAQFNANIQKPDTAMKVVISDASDIVQGDDAILKQGWKVTSTAANGRSTVNYIVNIGALSDDCVLTSKAGAGYEITSNKNEGKGLIANVQFGSTLKEFVEMLVVPANAKMEITDGNDHVIPLTMGSGRESTTESREYVDVLNRETYLVEVLAQNGITKISYSIKFADEASPSVTSDYYEVNQAEKKIMFVTAINVEQFLSRLIPSNGAEVWVANKMNQKREIGNIQKSDGIWVKKGNVATFYYLDWKEYGVDPAAPVKNVNESHGKVYPNPTAGAFTVNQKAKVTYYELKSLTGAIISTKRVDLNSFNVTELSSMNTGIYIITMHFENGKRESLKVIKR